MKSHPLRCRCGTLQGLVQVSPAATRAVCYCADCQAYARFLGGAIVDDSGGTEVVAMAPRYIRFTSGLESLACLSLSPRGLLRWYARCCNTPIGNTPRNHKIAYVGLLHSCLGDADARQAGFGPVKIVANTKAALGPVASVGLGSRVRALFNLGTSLLGSRLSGSYAQSPFFEPGSDAPVRPPHVLSPAERAKAYRSGAHG